MHAGSVGLRGACALHGQEFLEALAQHLAAGGQESQEALLQRGPEIVEALQVVGAQFFIPTASGVALLY